jgi:UDP-N-acetyl-2-amino-2-deoxyglucuronate dehydrogenase
MKRFALIGAAGFIAPRHMQAIRDTGNELVAALDPKDSVGVIDTYFPRANFFTEFERFDRHCEKLRRRGEGIDIVSICSPNYLHDAHIRFALRIGADAICEKPVVLNPHNVEALQSLEEEFGKRVYPVLQLRLHPEIKRLKALFDEKPKNEKRDVILTYITSRGRWYDVSWKGDLSRSGGVVTNIGIHFFDMLGYLFGGIERSEVQARDTRWASGVLELERAKVSWFLSVDEEDIPGEAREKGKRTFRSITIDGSEVEFSEGFGDLHVETYKEILAGRGFSMRDAVPSIGIAAEIRNAQLSGAAKPAHGFAARRLTAAKPT